MKRILTVILLLIIAGCSLFEDTKTGRIAYYTLRNEASTGYDFDISRELEHTKKGIEIYCYPFMNNGLPKPGMLCDEYDPAYSYITDLGFITLDSAVGIEDSIIELTNDVKAWHAEAVKGKAYMLNTAGGEKYVIYIDSIYAETDSLLCDHIIHFSFRKK